MDQLALERVEAQRIQLEENIGKLRKSLRHWQTLEIDYEGLKEEFMPLSEDASKEECLKAGAEFGAELVNGKELLTLIESAGRPRRPHQIVDVLTKRIEYVSRNVSTVRKQLSDAEKKRNALLLAEDSEHREEAGLPLTEITEELDEDGNIISSKVRTAASATPQLAEVLKKAGVNDVVDQDGTLTITAPLPVSSHTGKTGEAQSIVSKSPVTATTVAKSATSEMDNKQTDLVTTDSTPSPQISQTNNATSKDSTKSEIETDVTSLHPDDTEEDAALRQEMVEYGLGEVGAIVAELDLAEGSNGSGDDDSDSLLIGSDFDEDEDEDDEGSEDEKGMTKGGLMLSAAYKRRMAEIEEKLGMKNLGKPPNPEEIHSQISPLPPAEAARKAAIARAEKKAVKDTAAGNETSIKAADSAKKEKKKVSFADGLEIAPAVDSGRPGKSSGSTDDDRAPIRPISDNIMERQPASATTASSPQPPTKEKVSGFKAGRVESSQWPGLEGGPDSVDVVPKMKPGKIIAETLVERPGPRKNALPAPPDPDDIDDELHRRQIAAEYQRMRNRIVHRQGGYLEEEDESGEPIEPLPEEDEVTGKRKKVSRFKAARMK